MSGRSVAIYSCSPRTRGNSDRTGELLRETLAGAGAQVELVRLRKYKVFSCRGCHQCERDPHGHCFMADLDQSAQAFAPLLAADTVFLVSPIYFYHLPADFKAFIDRAQSFYARKLAGDETILSLPRRKAHVVLIAGRTRGEKLFTGSLLTLKYFLDPFNLEMAEPLLLRGLDAPDEFTASDEAQERVRAYARAALDLGD